MLNSIKASLDIVCSSFIQNNLVQVIANYTERMYIKSSDICKIIIIQV